MIAALDLGSGGVSVAVGCLEGDRLSIKDISWLPMEGVTRGEITNRQKVSDAVREAISRVEGKLGMRVSELYTGTAGRAVRWGELDYEVATRKSDGEVTAEDVKILRQAMEGAGAEEGSRILERVPLRFMVDGKDVDEPVGSFGKTLGAKYGFVLGSGTLLDRLEKTLLALGVRSKRILAGAVASARSVLLPEERELGVVVVDLGAGATDVCVVCDNAVRYVASVPFGSGDIDNDIKLQGILEKHVEDLKTTYGLAMVDQVKSDKLIKIPGRSPRENQEISQRNLATIIEQRLREIVGFVGQELRESGYADRLRGGVVLTGGGSQLAGVDELFREMLGMEVRLAFPDARVTEDSLEVAQNPARATVIGLLLMGLEDGSEGNGGGVVRSSAGSGIGALGEPKRAVSEPDDEREVDDDDEVVERRREKKPKRNPLKNWFDGFFSETLDGDEDL